MKKAFALFACIVLLAACQSSNNDKTDSTDTLAQESDSIVRVATDDTLAAHDAGDVVRDLKPGEPLSFKGLSRPMVVDFWATWCGPCMRFKPTFHAVSGRYSGRIDFVAVNVDECQDIADANNIQAIPALFLVKRDGTVVRHEGLMEEAEFEQFLSQAL